MNKELFGVYGDEARFRRFRSPAEFDRVVEGASVTVGVRDPALSTPHRTSVASERGATCVLWGEVYTPEDANGGAARWFLDRYDERGRDAFAELNGSYLAVVDRDDEAFVVTDQIRSRECFYADVSGCRVFGTDPVAVAGQIESPTIRPETLLEMLHLSVVTGDDTLLRQMWRVPFDGYLTESTTGALDRFVYEPRRFDYVAELAERLQRAMARRARLPGRKGLMLSGGYDSRVILAGIDDLDCSYTIGPPDGDVVAASRRVAHQYGVPLQALPVDERYLSPGPETIRYGQGIKESIHIHHAGYTRDIDADTIYHALHFDTLLRGHFLPRDDVEFMGYTMPRRRLDPDPDIVDTALRRLGIMEGTGPIVADCDCVEADSGREFVRSVVEDRVAALSDRYESTYDALEVFGIENQPTTPFRTHLADTHLESFIAADAELIDWHLQTPPEYRNTGVFLDAIERLDGDILRHPPHDRPHGSQTANGIEEFLRRKLPFVNAFDPPWPKRRRVYERRNLDERMFADYPEIHDLEPRVKLRINDVTRWLDMAVDGLELTPPELLCPPVDRATSSSPDRSSPALRAANE